MPRFGSTVVAGVVFVAGLAGLTPAADDKPADWSGFVSAGEVTGEVVKADKDGFRLKVNWLTAQNSSRSGRSRRGGGLRVTQHHAEYDLTFADAGLVRWQKLPPKLDDKGKKVSYTDKELADLKKPAGATGYAADREDLHPGQVVDVILVRPKNIPADKAQPSDLRVKYAVIIENTTKKEPEKKK